MPNLTRRIERDLQETRALAKEIRAIEKALFGRTNNKQSLTLVRPRRSEPLGGGIFILLTCPRSAHHHLPGTRPKLPRAADQRLLPHARRGASGRRIWVVWRYDRDEEQVLDVFGEVEESPIFVVTTY